MYNKLFSTIVTSSVWLSPSDHRVVWITFLALMDQDGWVPLSSIHNLAHTARVSLEAAQAAVAAFEGPDSFNPDQENQGRRIERGPNGWYVLNARKYAAMATAEKVREQTRQRNVLYRQRKGMTPRDASMTENSVISTTRDASVTPSDQIRSDQINPKTHTAAAQTARTRQKHSVPPEFERFKAIYPKRAGGQPWPRALSAINARLAEGHTWQEIIAGAERYGAYLLAKGDANSQFVQQAATFCGPQKGFLEEWTPPPPKSKPESAFDRIGRLNTPNDPRNGAIDHDPGFPALFGPPSQGK